MPGASGVIVYADGNTRDAAATGMPGLRPEIIFKPVADSTWLAWYYPPPAQSKELDDDEQRALAVRSEMRAVSKKYCDALTEARLNPGQRVVVLTAEFWACQSLYYAMKDKWAAHGFTVFWSAEQATNVYVTWAEA